MAELNRREFVVITAAACASACLANGALAAPPVLDPVDVGPVANFNKDGVDATYAKSSRFFLVSDKGQLVALSATCTHRGCVIRTDGGAFTCPCHGAQYTHFGAVVRKAPAPLPRLAISVNKDGHVIVDPRKEIQPADFNDPSASVQTDK